MRKIIVAALACAAAFAMAPANPAQALTTTPGTDGAMLIPTHIGASFSTIPVQYHRHHRMHYRHHRHHG